MDSVDRTTTRYKLRFFVFRLCLRKTIPELNIPNIIKKSLYSSSLGKKLKNLLTNNGKKISINIKQNPTEEITIIFNLTIVVSFLPSIYKESK